MSLRLDLLRPRYAPTSAFAGSTACTTRPRARASITPTVTLLALRAVGVMDARARGLVVQAVLPAKALVGA